MLARLGTQYKGTITFSGSQLQAQLGYMSKKVIPFLMLAQVGIPCTGTLAFPIEALCRNSSPV
jgi:hypothetical protein